MPTTWILYHAKCYDGFGAAWAAKYSLTNRTDVEYRALNYHSKLPTEIKEGDVVYMLDYSLNSLDEMRELAEKCVLTVIDHHISAWDNVLKHLTTKAEIIFNLNHSGAVLSWQYFHPCTKIPSLLLDIEDGDLWKFERQNTRYVRSGLMATPFEFDVWDEFIYDSGYQALIELGKPIASYEKNLINLMSKEVQMMDIGGYTVPVVNISTLFSDVTHKLLQDYPEAKFSAYRNYVKDGYIMFGLRSREGFDVSKIANIYGGGGHAQAAGFTIKECNSLQNALILDLLAQPIH